MVEQCLETAQETLSDLAGKNSVEPSIQQELCWIERQVSALQRYLQALLADLHSGMRCVELGFESEEEMLEAVIDVGRQVALLQSRYQAISRGMGR